MKFPENQKRRKSFLKEVFSLLLLCMLLFCVNNSITANAMGRQEVKAYVKVVDKLNVRAYPHLEAEIIGSLLPGEIVTVVSVNDNQWAEVKTNSGDIGFVKNDYLVIPKVDEEEYELLSVAVITKTDGSSENRNFNMAKAAEAINGLILEPEEEFAWYSTDKTKGTVGPASEENGYKEAPILLYGKSAMGFGGGVCQVSTALYNCINKIGILPTEHHHHSRSSSYVEEGMDATVNYPDKNFVFVNTKDYAIMFEAYTDDSQVIVVAYKALY